MKKVLIAISIVIIIIASLLFWKSNSSYTVTKLKKGKVIDAIYGLGRVKSKKSFEVKIGIMTNVKKLFVEEGQRVEKNQKLISFEGAGLFKAHFAGTVTNILLKESEIALPNISILKIVDLTNKFIEVSLEQVAALKVKKGQVATVIFDNYGKKEKGIVHSIYPKGNEFIAHIEVERLAENILPNMTADTVIIVGEKADALLIPVSSYHNGYVTRVRDGKKKKITVELGHADGHFVDVLSGDLNESDSVVIPKGK